MTRISSALAYRFDGARKALSEWSFLRFGLHSALVNQREKLASRLLVRRPRVAIVKQDCNEDLYCCPTASDPWTTISSSLLRSGPMDLFTLFDTQFFVVHTEDDPECNIWKEKSDPLNWMPEAWFESFRDRIPGRDHGQSLYAQPAASIDWSAFDLVVSIDVSVPARITRQYPGVVWSYFVREIKAPSWRTSLTEPIVGQDLVLSHRFDPISPVRAEHVVEFPYHFHHVGVFHELVDGSPALLDAQREGVFVEYHSAREATDEQLQALSAFGTVYAHRAADRKIDGRTGEWIPDRIVARPALDAIMRSKYHVKWDGRTVLGTGAVEAIAGGCLSLTNHSIDHSNFLHSRASLIDGFDDLIGKMRALESNPESFRRELTLQRERVDYLCHYRPANDLLDACARVLASRQRGI